MQYTAQSEEILTQSEPLRQKTIKVHHSRFGQKKNSNRHTIALHEQWNRYASETPLE